MERIVITGSSGALGRRVTQLLSEAGHEVVGLDNRQPDSAPVHGRGKGGPFHTVDLTAPDTDLKALLVDADSVIHLAAGPADTHANITMARHLLVAAADSGVTHLVLLSSAAVYGAWSDNPVPLTEDAPLRPNPGFAYAFEKAEIERLALEWSDAHPSARVAVLRPARVLGPDDHSGWLARATAPSLLDRLSEELPSMQYLHIDDLAAAIAIAATAKFDGPLNIAPDGWLRGEEVGPLLGPSSPVPMPEKLVERLRRYRRSGEVPGASPYARQPWVIANDRAKTLGWRPATTTQEAIVASRPPSKLAKLFARRRQEITLAAVTGAALLALGGSAVWWRRTRRR